MYRFQDPQLFNQILSTPIVSVVTPTQTTSMTPAFLARFPRSLSSLSLGGKKKTIEKESPSTMCTSSLTGMAENEIAQLPTSTSFSGHLLPPTHIIPQASVKNKFTGSTKDLKSINIDQPPPLPQRNITRRSQVSPPTTQTDGNSGDIDFLMKRNTQISDLDQSLNISGGQLSLHADTITVLSDASNSYKNTNKLQSTSPTALISSPSSKSCKKRNKTKIKANSDPKISSQLLIQMEKDYDKEIIAATGHSVAIEPPPLPPRQPGMLEENQNILNSNKFIVTTSINNRPSPNSLDTKLNYPLIATCTAVRDNISPFPLSHRPNIKQQLQQNSANTVLQHHTKSPSNKSTVSN